MGERNANHFASAGVLAAFFALCAPLLSRNVEVFDDLDERLFHLPTIQGFIDQLPYPDLVNYPSATTPLYHLVMATLALVIGDELHGLRAANLLLSICALSAAIWAIGKRGALLALPLALSPYFVGPAVRLSTDNAALLGIFLGLGFLLRKDDKPLSGGLAATAAVLTRQIHAWILGLLVLKAIQKRTPGAIAALVIPLAALGAVVGMWGALTPPGFAKGHSAGLNPHTTVFALSMFGLYGPFVLGWLAPTAKTHWRRAIAAAGVACIGLACISMPYTVDPNRWGGAVWQLAARTPDVLDMSLSFWILVPTGAAVLAIIASTGRHGATLTLAVVLWLVANLASARAYQKYYDPMALFVLGMSVQGLKGHRLAWLGPALLSAGLGAVTLLRFYG